MGGGPSPVPRTSEPAVDRLWLPARLGIAQRLSGNVLIWLCRAHSNPRVVDDQRKCRLVIGGDDFKEQIADAVVAGEIIPAIPPRGWRPHRHEVTTAPAAPSSGPAPPSGRHRVQPSRRTPAVAASGRPDSRDHLHGQQSGADPGADFSLEQRLEARLLKTVIGGECFHQVTATHLLRFVWPSNP